MSEKKTNCYFNDRHPPKTFVIYKGSQVAEAGRIFFKVPDTETVIGCLAPRENGAFTQIIDIFPQDFPDNLYFYSIPKNIEHLEVKKVTIVDMRNQQKKYQFKMSPNNNLEDLNNKFRHQRNADDKTPFVYLINNVQLESTFTFAQISDHNINIVAQPKLVHVQVRENGRILYSAQIGLNTMKKNNARQLFQTKLSEHMNLNPQNFKNHQIFYEYRHKRIPENQNLDVRAGDRVVLSLISKTTQNIVTVSVQIVFENRQRKKSQIPLQSIQYKVPSQIASFFVQEFDLYQKQISVQVDNQPLGASQYFKKGKNIILSIFSNHKKSSKISPLVNPVQTQYAFSSQFQDFKLQLKRLLDLPNSQNTDRDIKHLIGCYITEQIKK